MRKIQSRELSDGRFHRSGKGRISPQQKVLCWHIFLQQAHRRYVGRARQLEEQPRRLFSEVTSDSEVCAGFREQHHSPQAGKEVRSGVGENEAKVGEPIGGTAEDSLPDRPRRVARVFKERVRDLWQVGRDRGGGRRMNVDHGSAGVECCRRRPDVAGR